MFSHFHRVYAFLCSLPFIGNAFCHATYVLLMPIAPLIAWLLGGCRLVYGKSKFLSPKEKAVSIKEGAELLRKCDPDMFARFTQQKLNIAYSYNIRSLNNGGRFYNLHDRYVKLGPEGIAVFLIQCTLLAEASPSLNRFRLKKSELAALKIAPQKVLEWMRQHSFHPGFIKSYGKVVEEWEAAKRFSFLRND